MKKQISLPKGGYVVDTSIGPLQFVAPPETIKDCLAMEREVSSIYIAPKFLFSHTRMVSLLDIEFPVYYNFFFRKRKVTVLCTAQQKDSIARILHESFFGPEELNLEIEYLYGKENHYFPDMRREMDFFAHHPKEDRLISLNDLIDFVVIVPDETVNWNGLEISIDTGNDQIRVVDGDEETFFSWAYEYEKIEVSLEQGNDIFLPPIFGITTLGSSHGFDPHGRTSGFIFWLNGGGIMIDPPVDSALWLIEENVDPRMVNSVILTHCHSDHDAGVMQKILQEGRITLYTTPTVFSNFVRKTALITGLTEVDIVELIEFIPVTIGKPVNINGGRFTFKYRLHSIPTIGFEVFFKGKTVVYTSDHLNDQRFFDDLYGKKILTEGRYEELSNFNWNRDVIIHEAGTPPIHTPLETILALDEEIKKHVYLVHTDKSKLPADSGLTISPTGLANTMIIEVPQSVHGESVQILNLVTGLDIFQDIKFEKSAEFLSIVKYRQFFPGDCIVKEGVKCKRFHIIIAGRAKLIEEGVDKAILTSGSYFGETTIILNEVSRNTIIALTELITLSVDKEDFLMFIFNTPIYEKLKKLGKVRKFGSWQSISLNPIFESMTINQKNFMELLFEYHKADKDEVIFSSGEVLEFAILWNTGVGVIVDDNKNEKREVRQGDFIGNPRYLLGEKIPQTSLIAGTDSSFFKISWDAMLKFFQKNPRIFLELRDLEDI